MVEDCNRIENCASVPPLHLQERTEINHASRDSEEESSSDGIASFHGHRRRPSSMSKRISISQKNEYGRSQGEANSSRRESFYTSNEPSSIPSLSHSSTPNPKYSRRKNNRSGCHKFLGQRFQLFLMMVALGVLSCAFSYFLTLDLFASDYSYDGHHLVHSLRRSKNDRPRILTLFDGSSGRNIIHNKYYSHPRAKSFVAGLMDLPANFSVIMYGDLSFEIENAAAEPEPEPEPKPAVATTNSSVVPPPPSFVAAEEKTCLPMANWMTASYPTCNSVHEIDMHQGILSVTYDDEEDLKFLGQGWFRDTWKYVNDNLEGLPPVVIKTLRIEREFLDEYFDLHRRDTVAMERLTFSPYVINVHGYCGQSAINELADGIMGGKINNLEQLNRRLRGKETDNQALLLKLQLASKVSLGLAHVHNIHVSDNSGGRSKSVQSLLFEHTDPNSAHSTTGFGRSVPTMAHYDINPRNIAIMSDGSPKLNDFNIAEFLTYDPKTNKTCGFRSRLHEPWWRAPEEMDTSHQTMVDEKVDVYALGEVLFHILTTHGPRGKMNKPRMEEVRELVKKGKRPDMWEPYASDPTMKKHPIVRAFFKALDLCFEPDPVKRGTSIQVARVLNKELAKIEESRDSKPRGEPWNK